jgi:hypothetical protein
MTIDETSSYSGEITLNNNLLKQHGEEMTIKFFYSFFLNKTHMNSVLTCVVVIC